MNRENYMSRKIFTQKIQNIQDEVLLLGSMVEEAVTKSVLSLRNLDRFQAQQIYEEDAAINDKRYAIENGILIVFGDICLLSSEEIISLEPNAYLVCMGNLKFLGGVPKGSIESSDDPQ